MCDNCNFQECRGIDSKVSIIVPSSAYREFLRDGELETICSERSEWVVYEDNGIDTTIITSVRIAQALHDMLTELLFEMQQSTKYHEALASGDMEVIRYIANLQIALANMERSVEAQLTHDRAVLTERYSD